MRSGFPHWSYPLVMLAAVAVGAWLSRRSQSRLGLTAEQQLAIGLGAFCGAMLGAKLPYLLADPAGLVSGRAWLDGGKTIVFGLAGGYLGVELAKALTGVRVKTGDSFAVPVAASVAVGRLGCFVGRCCYGEPTALPWGLDFGDGFRRHPSQLYEAGFHAVAAVVLAVLKHHGLLRGQLIKAYILAYLGFRFVTEPLRPDFPRWGPLTAMQWATLALAPAFVALWVVDARAMRRTTRSVEEGVPTRSVGTSEDIPDGCRKPT